MILYFSGASSKIVTQFMIKHNCSRLFSYYSDKKIIESKICNDVFLDCGAWTAFTKNVNINIDEYLEYLKVNKDCYKVAASLDVIPQNNSSQSAKDSYDNFVYLRNKLRTDCLIIPTYHRGESIDNLKRLLLYSDNYGQLDYIGIGAVASNVNAKMRDNFLQNIFNVIYKERPDIKIHLFGLTDLSLLTKYPIYSADSTTWVMAGAMGEILTDFGRIKISDKNFHIKAIGGYSDEQLMILDSYVNSFGFTLDELRQSAEHRKMFNVLYMKTKVDNLNCVNTYIPRKSLF